LDGYSGHLSLGNQIIVSHRHPFNLTCFLGNWFPLLLDNGFVLLLLDNSVRLLLPLPSLDLQICIDLERPKSPFDESCESHSFLALRSLLPLLAMKADFDLSKLALLESGEGRILTSLSSTINMVRSKAVVTVN
jgi:hypothetical protein